MSNTFTIFRKECSRFFRDRALVFTAIIMPGLLIYLIYTFIGTGMKKEIEEKTTMSTQNKTVMMVEHMPAMFAPLVDSLPVYLKTGTFDTASVFAKLRNKENNMIYVVFPAEWQYAASLSSFSLSALSDSGLALTHSSVPNIRIYYNSDNSEALTAYNTVRSLLEGWEAQQCNLFDINAAEGDDPEAQFDLVASDSQSKPFDDILSGLIPMLIIMLLFSGSMAVAPSSIAGEKERGTIATLLVTPMNRSELALGKILSLSLFALLSGISSFVGIMLSVPKMIASDPEAAGAALDGNFYSMTDYICLLGIILSTVLVIISCISLLSALAKNVSAAGTYTVPFMLVMMILGLSPLYSDGIPTQTGVYCIPLYNSIQSMAAIFSRESQWLHVLVTIGSNVVCMVLAVVGLTKMFNSEKIMFNK